MSELVYGPIMEVLALLAYSLAAGALTVVGLLAESAGVSNIVAGNLTLGAWEVWMGALGLYVGVYLLGYCELYPRLQDRFSTAG